MLWKPKTLGHVVAERVLTFHKGRRTRRVVFAVGCPVKAGDTLGGWWCPFEFRGLGRKRFYTLAGEDALQALLLAVNFARKIAPTLVAQAGGTTLSWLGDLDFIYDHDKTEEFYARVAGEALGVLRRIDRHVHEDGRTIPRTLRKQLTKILRQYPEHPSGPA